MSPIPQSQFDHRQYAVFDLSRVFQCSDIQLIEDEVEAIRRGLSEEVAYRNRQAKSDEKKLISFGPVVVGEATAVTDHIDVFQYYRLEPINEIPVAQVANPEV